MMEFVYVIPIVLYFWNTDTSKLLDGFIPQTFDVWDVLQMRSYRCYRLPVASELKRKYSYVSCILYQIVPELNLTLYQTNRKNHPSHFQLLNVSCVNSTCCLLQTRGIRISTKFLFHCLLTLAVQTYLWTAASHLLSNKLTGFNWPSGIIDSMKLTSSPLDYTRE